MMKIPVFTAKPYVEKLGRGKLQRRLRNGWGRTSAFAEVDERQILGFIFCASDPAGKVAPEARLARAFDVEAIPLPPAADHEIPVGFVGPIPGLGALQPQCF